MHHMKFNRRVVAGFCAILLATVVVACEPPNDNPGDPEDTTNEGFFDTRQVATSQAEAEATGQKYYWDVSAPIYARAEDSNGNPILPPSTSTLSASSTTDGWVPVDTGKGAPEPDIEGSSGGFSTLSSSGSGALWNAGPSGCGSVKQIVKVKSFFGFTMIEWAWTYSWCWGYGAVVNPSTRMEILYLEHSMVYGGRINHMWYCYSTFYDVYGGRHCAAHRGYRMDQAVGNYSLLGVSWTATARPWANLRSHNNGTYSWSRGSA